MKYLQRLSYKEFVDKSNSKSVNNKFTNFQRRDRKQGAGAKLYLDFMKNHGVSVKISYKEFVEKCERKEKIEEREKREREDKVRCHI